MKEVLFPYGKSKLSCTFQENELAGVLTSFIDDYVPEGNETELI